VYQNEKKMPSVSASNHNICAEMYCFGPFPVVDTACKVMIAFQIVSDTVVRDWRNSPPPLLAKYRFHTFEHARREPMFLTEARRDIWVTTLTGD